MSSNAPHSPSAEHERRSSSRLASLAQRAARARTEVGIGHLIGRPARAVALIAVGAAGAGTAIAVASVPDSNGVIHACVELQQDGHPQFESPNLKVIDPSAGQNCVTTGGPAGGPPPEQAISWNTVGQQGPQGVPGPQAPQGVPGPQGVQGPAGPEGHTLTLNGQTFTINGLANAPTATVEPSGLVAPLSVNGGGRPVATLTGLDVGPGAPSTIEVDSWSFGANQAGTQSHGSGGGAGRTEVHEIQITKTVDKASSVLFKACASGQHFKTATLTARKAGGRQQEYLQITMQNVLISSYQQSNGGGKQPVESLSLHFTKPKFTYVPQKP